MLMGLSRKRGWAERRHFATAAGAAWRVEYANDLTSSIDVEGIEGGYRAVERTGARIQHKVRTGTGIGAEHESAVIDENSERRRFASG